MTNRVRIPFYPPEWRGTPVKLGILWTLTKGKREAVCVLWNHPVGAEMRLDVDGDLMQSKASRATFGELLDAAAEWRRAFEEKGWS